MADPPDYIPDYMVTTGLWKRAPAVVMSFIFCGHFLNVQRPDYSSQTARCSHHCSREKSFNINDVDATDYFTTLKFNKRNREKVGALGKESRALCGLRSRGLNP